VRIVGRDWVALAFLGAAACLGGWIALRTGLGLGATWSDGERLHELSDDALRYAVWDAPRPLDVPADASRLAFSRDGRYAAFSTGEPGLNADLWLAEIVDGVLAEATPLTALNSPFDELAPAFGEGELLFASNRTGGGFDLYRAPFEDGLALEPAPILGAVTSEYDELDPCPVPGTRELLFVSNRPRDGRGDFDLYHAAPAGDDWSVEALERLCTLRDEREPALSPDARALVFAADAGDARGFDLYRSFREAGAWLPREPLDELNSERSERTPAFAHDAFEVAFAVEDPPGSRAFASARSLEVYRVPPPPPGLAELLLLVLLVLTGLLAWLSKRWTALDILYKCFLVSVLIHILLLLFLRDVHPDPGARAAGTGTEERAFRVRLESPGAERERERGGEIELEARRVEASEQAPERLASDAPASEAAPAEVALAAPEREEQLPERSTLAPTEDASASAPDPELADRETLARLDATAPRLALGERRPDASAPAREAAGPARAETQSEAAAAAAPLAAALPDLPSESDAQVAAESSERADLARADPSTDAPTPDVRAPGPEARPTAAERPSASFDALAGLPQRSGAASPAEPANAPERRAPQASGSAAVEARPSAAALPTLAEGSDADAGSPARERTSVAPGASSPPEAAVALRAPAESRSRAGADQPRAEFDALAGLARAPEAERASDGLAAPERAQEESGRNAATSLAPASRPAVPALEEPAETGASRERVALASEPSAQADEGLAEPALRAPTEGTPAARADTAPAPSFDALAGLARPAEAERAGASLDAPGRHAPAAASETPAASAAPLAFRVPESLAPAREDRPRLEQTPYKNRFGTEKLRALQEFGGSVETERAVAAGLAYLARIQDVRGSWGDARDFHEKYGDVRIGKTGLALLAFLGAGHTAMSGTEHSGVAERALGFLLREQDDAGGHFGESSSYDHGIATYAIAECYAMTKEERLRGPLERAVAHILACQSRERDPRFFGGWGYFLRSGEDWQPDPWPRVSVSAWQVMALESATLGGLEVPAQAFDDARTYLARTWDPPRGAFRYSHDPERLGSGYPILPASTPAAIFALSLLGADVSSDEFEPARRFVLERSPDGYRYTGPDDFVFRARGNLYFWYYGTLAMFRAGGSDWERWNAAMKETLLPAQEEDGSWRPIDVYAEYAGDEDGNRAYTTSMCVLALEIYYRYFTPLLAVR
jgi:hypothetical protein